MLKILSKNICKSTRCLLLLFLQLSLQRGKATCLNFAIEWAFESMWLYFSLYFIFYPRRCSCFWLMAGLQNKNNLWFVDLLFTIKYMKDTEWIWSLDSLDLVEIIMTCRWEWEKKVHIIFCTSLSNYIYSRVSKLRSTLYFLILQCLKPKFFFT